MTYLKYPTEAAVAIRTSPVIIVVTWMAAPKLQDLCNSHEKGAPVKPTEVNWRFTSKVWCPFINKRQGEI